MRPDYKEFVSEPGERYAPVYTPEVNKEGIITLTQTGVKDLFEVHQADFENSEINHIVSKFMATGDTSYINRVNGFYDDVVGAPKSLADAYNSIVQAQGIFERLPVEIRAVYEHNFYNFIHDFGSDHFAKVFAPKDDVKENEEVTTDEQKP